MPDPRRRLSLRPPVRAHNGGLGACALSLSVLGPAVIAGLLTALSATVRAAPAAAAAPCAPREVLLRRLAEGYGEAPQALGLTANGALLEVLVSPGGRSFSILVTRPPYAGQPGQVSCLVAAGEAWRSPDPANGTGVQPDRES